MKNENNIDKPYIIARDIKMYIDEIANFDEFKNLEDLDIILKTCYRSRVGDKYILSRNFILEENVKKYKPEELTDDLIPSIETLLKNIESNDLEDKAKEEKHKDKLFKREMTQRVKCICLYKMNKSIMTNTFDLSVKDRTTLEIMMHSYEETPYDDIIKEFNDIACNDLFDNNNIDYSKYPIYNYSNFL